MTDDQIATLRRYKPAEVVQLLNIPAKRLKAWVQEDRVPYQCAGVERGVWFTAEDIRRIGEKLPELMGGRRSRRGAGPLGGQPEGAAASQTEPPAVDLAAWAQLKAHRPRPRARVHRA